MLYKLCLASSANSRCAVICTASKRFYSEDIRTIRNIDTASLKRGTGGRSSFNGQVVTVFGASGFLGTYICNQLGKRGCQLIIPHRSDLDDYEVKRLKLVGDLGQVLFHPFNLKDPLSIRKAVKYSNVVINLIGRNFETPNFSFNDVHVHGAREIAMACKEYNVERLIHFSALSLHEKPQKYYLKKIDFLPSKLKGEEAVLEEFPTATIFRPGAVYGPNDTFLWPLCTKKRHFFLSTPLYAKGEKTIKQPVYASDVAEGVVAAINDYGTRGKIFQAVGPERYYLRDISIFCSQTLQRHVDEETLVHDIKYDFRFAAKILFYRYFIEMFQHKPRRHLSFEAIERESVSDVVDPSLPTLEDLGVKLTLFEDIVPNMIFNTFKYLPAQSRQYENYLAMDSLSKKAVSAYDF